MVLREAKLEVLLPMMSIEEGEVNANSLAATRDKCQVAGYCRASDTLQISDSFWDLDTGRNACRIEQKFNGSIVHTAYGIVSRESVGSIFSILIHRLLE